MVGRALTVHVARSIHGRRHFPRLLLRGAPRGVVGLTRAEEVRERRHPVAGTQTPPVILRAVGVVDTAKAHARRAAAVEPEVLARTHAVVAQIIGTHVSQPQGKAPFGIFHAADALQVA